MGGALGGIVKAVVGGVANMFLPGIGGMLTNALFDAFMKQDNQSTQGSGNNILGNMAKGLLGGGGSGQDGGIGSLLGMGGSGAMSWLGSLI